MPVLSIAIAMCILVHNLNVVYNLNVVNLFNFIAISSLLFYLQRSIVVAIVVRSNSTMCLGNCIWGHDQ